MKRTELKRGSSQLKRTELKRGTSQLSRESKIAPRSEKRKKHMKEERVPAVQALVEAGETCQIGPVLRSLQIDVKCSRVVQGLHERRKSGAGGSRVNPANLIPACNVCNGLLEDAVGKDREKIEASHLVVRERDPEWGSLGKKQDKMLPDDTVSE